MLEANGIVKIDNDHNAMLTRKGKRYIEMNELEIMERWKELHDRKVLEDKRKKRGRFWLVYLIFAFQLGDYYFYAIVKYGEKWKNMNSEPVALGGYGLWSGLRCQVRLYS